MRIMWEDPFLGSNLDWTLRETQRANEPTFLGTPYPLLPHTEESFLSFLSSTFLPSLPTSCLPSFIFPSLVLFYFPSITLSAFPLILFFSIFPSALTDYLLYNQLCWILELREWPGQGLYLWESHSLVWGPSCAFLCRHLTCNLPYAPRLRNLREGGRVPAPICLIWDSESVTFSYPSLTLLLPL